MADAESHVTGLRSRARAMLLLEEAADDEDEARRPPHRAARAGVVA